MSTIAIGPVPIQQFFDNQGLVLNGGLLYVYVAGGLVDLTVYKDSGSQVAWSQPIVLDSAGRIPGEIFPPSTTSAKYVLKTSAGVVVWTADNVPPTAIVSDRVVQTSTVVGTQNNFALTTGATFLRMNNASAAVITGFAAGADAQQLVIAAIGAGTVTLNNNDAGSSTGNKIITGTGAAIVLQAGTGTAILEYDLTSGVWRVLSSLPNGTTGQLLTATATGPAWKSIVACHVTNSGTPATLNAVNVLSLTDNGAGDTTVTFTTAMPSANYAANVTRPSNTGSAVGYAPGWETGTHLAGSIRVLTTDAGGNPQDVDFDLICIGG